MDNKKSIKLSVILSIFWIVGSAISSFGLYAPENSTFLAITIFLLAAYWIIVLKYGNKKFQNFFETSKYYAPILEVTNLVLQIKNLKKEAPLPLTTLKYRGLYILAVSILIISYFFSNDLELAEKLGTVLIYSPFIFLAFNGKKTAYIVFFMLISLDCLAGLLSGGVVVHNLMKWLLLSIVTLNTYTVEKMKK